MPMPASKRTKILSLLAASAALAIAGCGGDDDETTSGATGATGVGGAAPLSEEEFVSQANAICADANSQIEAIPAPTSNDAQAIGDYAREVLAVAEPLIEQFDALVPPENLQSEFDEYTAQVQEQAALDRQLVTAADAGDTQEMESLLQELDSIDTDQQAAALGLDECAKDPQPQG